MKILYLHQYFNTPAMPGGTRSYEMGRRLVAAGHDVHMVTTCRKRNAPRAIGEWFETEEAGMRVHWLVNPYDNAMSNPDRVRSFMRYAVSSMRFASRLGGDIVFATSTPLTVAIPALAARSRNRIPLVFEVRDLWPEGPIAVGALRNPVAITLARFLERRAYFGARHVIALSPAMRDGVLATGYPAADISVIPNSSDVDLFRVPAACGDDFLRRHPHLAGGPIVVYTGTLGLLNGVAYLAELAAAMATINPNVRFLVVGEGREATHIRDRARALGILDRSFWMLNGLPKQDIPAVLSACTVACSLFIDHPYTRQNSPNKAFDAFAAGRPLAVNHAGWIADLLRESNAGLVLPLAPPAAALALHQFLADPVRLAAAREASARLADERFSRDRLAADLIRILERTAAH